MRTNLRFSRVAPLLHYYYYYYDVLFPDDLIIFHCLHLADQQQTNNKPKPGIRRQESEGLPRTG